MPTRRPIHSLRAFQDNSPALTKGSSGLEHSTFTGVMDSPFTKEEVQQVDHEEVPCSVAGILDHLTIRKPRDLKTWGKLKTWAAQNLGLLPAEDVARLDNLQYVLPPNDRAKAKSFLDIVRSGLSLEQRLRLHITRKLRREIPSKETWKNEVAFEQRITYVSQLYVSYSLSFHETSSLISSYSMCLAQVCLDNITP